MPETVLRIDAEDHASTTIKGLTGSIIGAGAALAVIIEIAKKVWEMTKEAVQEWEKEEDAIAKLKVVAGDYTSQLVKFSEQEERVTNYGKDLLMNAEAIGLQMGISKTNIEQATKYAEGLAATYGIDLSSAMRMVAKEQEGNYTALQRFIPALKNATSEADKHKIAIDFMSRGYETAIAKTDTFSGILQANKNASMDVLKHVGLMTEALSRDYIKAMTDSARKTADWLDSQKGVETVARIYQVLATVLQTAVSTLYIIYDLTSKIIAALGHIGTAIGNVFSGKFKEAGEQMKSLGGDFVKFKDDFLKESNKIGDTWAKSYDSFLTNYKKIMGEVVKSTQGAMTEASSIITESFKKDFDKTSGYVNTGISGLKAVSDQYYKNQTTAAQGNAEELKKIQQDQFNASKAFGVADTIIKTAQAVVNALATAGPIFGPILGLAIGAEGAAQTALIAAEPMPAFAMGGTAPGGYALVGERGPELVNLPSGSRVFNNQESKNMSGFGDIHIHGNIVANNPVEFYRQISIAQNRLERGRGIA